MKEFIRKHESRIHGVLSCFDRMLFRGHLPIVFGWGRAQFLNSLQLNGSHLKALLLENSERVKSHAVAMDGEHCLSGFSNRDIRTQLQSTPHLCSCAQDHKKAGAKVSRIFRRMHTHGVIAKIPRPRRRRVTIYGRRVMGTALYLREHDFARAYAKLAA